MRGDQHGGGGRLFLTRLCSSPSIYPVVPGNGRFVAEAEVVVGNYRFPKKVGEPIQEVMLL